MNNYWQKPPTLREVKEKLSPIRNVNAVFKEKLTGLEMCAVWIAGHVGSMGFFSIILAWTIIWLLWNITAPVELRFDPYPAFVLWLFISNMVQLFLLPLLLIGQNIQSKHADARSEVDFEVDTKSEKEIEAVLLHLEHQHEQIEKLLQKIEKMEEKN